tara:strand:- start:142 stop:372 length:231 start_codon:yes stop_codon:yes gene_type:complete
MSWKKQFEEAKKKRFPMEEKRSKNTNKQKNTKMEKLKNLLELVSEVDIMYHEEHKEYFFEWMKDGKFINIWLGDYV